LPAQQQVKPRGMMLHPPDFAPEHAAECLPPNTGYLSLLPKVMMKIKAKEMRGDIFAQ